MKTRVFVYVGSVILAIAAIFAMAISIQEPATVNVDILPDSAIQGQDEYLSPKTIKVVIGVNNTVRWNNIDNTSHTLTPDHMSDGFSTSIGLLKPGESEERTFEIPGVYDYHGTPGPWITGTIIVEEQ